MQKLVLGALQHPETYDEKIKKIKLVQTYHSFVFLTGDFAYKIKKSVKFPYFDFSNLEKRKEDLEKELKLNRRLSPDLYLGVFPITQENGKIKINGQGKIVEYVLKMKEIPEKFLMYNLLERNEIDKPTIDKLAKIISDFHLKAEISSEVEKFGSIETIKLNWKENFDQTKKFIGRVISSNQFKLIERKIHDFILANESLFKSRINNKKIKDCHGDLHSGSIFIADKIYIFDSLEFIDRFRYSDVASEIAFLAMDLDFHGKKSLSDYFIEKYVEFTRDKELLKLLKFYKCYRAYVRGKVASFKLNDENISEKEKGEATKEAKKYFDLAFSYAKLL